MRRVLVLIALCFALTMPVRMLAQIPSPKPGVITGDGVIIGDRTKNGDMHTPAGVITGDRAKALVVWAAGVIIGDLR